MVKLATMHRAQLMHMKETGTLPSESFLHAVLRSIALTFKCDVQLIESINSLIRILGMRCRNMAYELLWARVMVKKTILPDRSDTQLWRDMKHGLANLHEQVMTALKNGNKDYHRLMKEFSDSNPCRFWSPRAFVVSERKPKYYPAELCSRAVWSWAHCASSEVLKALRQLPQPHGWRCLRFGVLFWATTIPQTLYSVLCTSLTV